MAIVMRKLLRPQVNFYLRNLSSQSKLVEVEQKDSGDLLILINELARKVK